MKILKYLGILILFVLVAALIGMFVMPTEVKIERSITIKAPTEIIWSNIKYFTNFPKWSPWHKKEPNIKVTYSGTDGEVGSEYSWAGNKDVGTGTQK